MPSSSSHDVTLLLGSLRCGDREALARVLPLIYEQLRGLADRALRHERPGHTLQATALLHEAFLRLVDQERVRWQNRAHFFGVAAQMMRRVLIDYARRRQAVKRRHVAGVAPAFEASLLVDERDVDLVALDEAMDRLARLDPRQCRMVELRFFAGLSIEETAEMLESSPATVKRDWAVAKAWLHREISHEA